MVPGPAAAWVGGVVAVAGMSVPVSSSNAAASIEVAGMSRETVSSVAISVSVESVSETRPARSAGGRPEARQERAAVAEGEGQEGRRLDPLGAGVERQHAVAERVEGQRRRVGQVGRAEDLRQAQARAPPRNRASRPSPLLATTRSEKPSPLKSPASPATGRRPARRKAAAGCDPAGEVRDQGQVVGPAVERDEVQAGAVVEVADEHRARGCCPPG